MHRRKSCLFGKMLYQQLWPSVPHPFSSQGGLGIALYTNTIPSLEVATGRTEMTVYANWATKHRHTRTMAWHRPTNIQLAVPLLTA